MFDQPPTSVTEKNEGGRWGVSISHQGTTETTWYNNQRDAERVADQHRRRLGLPTLHDKG